MQIYLTAGDAAQILEVTPATVRDMADRGDLEVAAKTQSGVRLLEREAVEHLAAKRYAEKEMPSREPGGNDG